MRFLARHPTLVVGVLEAALGVAIVFGLDMTGEQKAAVVALAAACLALAGATWTQVTPVSKVADALGTTKSAVGELLKGVTRPIRDTRPPVLSALVLAGALVALAAGPARADNQPCQGDNACQGRQKKGCAEAQAPCSDDDNVQVVICAHPDACRFEQEPPR